MLLRWLVCASLILTVPLSFAQYQCTAGQAASAFAANVGQSCTTISQPTGQEIHQDQLNASMTSQTICDTSSTCPAGLYVLTLYMEPETAGTLVSAVSAQITYTSDTRTYTAQAIPNCGSLSLVGTTPLSCFWNFYKAANTAVTVQTNAVNLTGAPTYSFRARINLIGNN